MSKKERKIDELLMFDNSRDTYKEYKEYFLTVQLREREREKKVNQSFKTFFSIYLFSFFSYLVADDDDRF